MSNNFTESNKPSTIQEVFMHPVNPVHYHVSDQMHLLYKLQTTNIACARFTDHRKFNMEPVWFFFWVVTLEMDPALKRTCAFIQREFLSWPVLCMEISLHDIHHWPNQR